MKELIIINAMLRAKGKNRVQSVHGTNNTINTTISDEYHLLKEVLHEVLYESWHCNTIKNKLLQRTAENHIYFPSNTLDWKFTNVQRSNYIHRYDLIKKGDRLFNKTKNTYEMTQDYYVHIIEEVSIEDLPYHLFQYVKSYAVLRAVQNADTTTQGTLKSRYAEYMDNKSKAYNTDPQKQWESNMYRSQHIRSLHQPRAYVDYSTDDFDNERYI